MSEFTHSYALVIGINGYGNGISSLKTPVSDATEIAHLLESKHHYTVNLLLDRATTLSQLRQVLETELPKQIQAGDRFLFYFAGHGIALNGEDGPEGYLVPQNAKFGTVSTYLPMSEVNKALLQLPCRHFLGILDCCFAGAFRWSSTRKLIPIELGTIHKERYDRFIQDPAWQMITSAAYDQTALDVFDLKDDRGQIGVHSPFACALIEALQGKADAFPPAELGKPAGDGVITASELYLYLRDRVEIATEARAIRQTPGIYPLNKHDKGEYIFLTPGHALNLPPAPPLDVSKNPYRGLSPFEEEHCNLFFGRNALTQKLYEFVTSHPLTVVLGASGSGKSSLVKAGLIPKLRQCKDDNTWFILPPFRPGESPFRALNNALASVNRPVIATPSQANSGLLTPAQSLANWFKEHPQANLLLVVDQFEELITLCRNQQEQQQFLEALKEAIATYPQQLHLVLTLRSDFEPQFHNTNLEKDWQTARFVVPAMTREELRQAIEEPASARVMYFDPHELVEQLIDEVANMPGALPLLSFALSELYLRYLKRQEDAKNRGETIERAITQADYEELGGVTRSLTQRADREYEALVHKDRAYERTIRHVMLRMVAVGGELARRRVPLSELKYPELENTRVREVIQQFSAARLLVSGTDTDDNSYVEPAHDALIRGWQKLLIWKKQEQENLTLQRRLTPAAEEWDRKRQTRFLWNANPYLEVLQKQVLNSPNHNWLNQVEAEFVRRSASQKRRNICTRWSLVTVAFLLLSGATIIAFKNDMDAQNKSLESSSSLAQSLLVSGREWDALIEATKTGEMLKKMENTFIVKNFFVREDTKIQVVTTLQQIVYGLSEWNHWVEPNKMTVSSVSFSPDGRTIASGSVDGTIELWGYNGKLIQTLPKQKSPVFSVKFSPDGQTLISATQKEGVNFWQHQPDGSFALRKSIPDRDEMMAISFSAKNKMIATASLDPENTIKLWSWDGKLLRTFLGHKDRVNDLSFSPDGQRLASASGDKTIKLWSLKDGKLRKTINENNVLVQVRFVDNQTLVYAVDDGTIKLRKVNGETSTNFQERHSDSLEGLALSHDGKFLASASRDRTVKLWSLKDRKLLKTFKGHESVVTDVSFSPDSKMIVSAGEDRSVRIWKLDNKMPTIEGSSLSFSRNGQMIVTGQGTKIMLWHQDGKLQRIFPEGHQLDITKVSFAPNGQLIASASADGTAKLWHLNGKLRANLEGHKEQVTSVSFSPNGKIIATASLDKTVKLWGLDGTRLKTFNAGSPVTSVSFSPNGEIIAAGCQDMTVKLWHLNERLNGIPLPSLTGHKGTVLDVSFSPNGKMIASASVDRNIMLWDLNGQPRAVLTGHQNNIYRVKFSPSGQTLVSASTDNTIRFWNLNGELLRTWEGNNDENFFDVSFNSKGTALASADSNGKVILINLNLDKLLKRSCSWLHDYLVLQRQDYSTPNQNGSSKLCK